MIEVKICGVRDAEAVDAAVAAGADWIGFVFFSGSPRAITPAQAARLSARHSGGPGCVGLFVAPQDFEVDFVLQSVTLDAVQLYAGAERAAELHARFGVPVWRSVGVVERDDLPHTEAGVDRFVIEPRPPVGASRPGGNAVALDPSLLGGWLAPAPWMLAGGLTPANVAAAIRRSRPCGVDVSSGVETAPGRKDPGLIRAFVAAAKRRCVLQL
jgi:phosphoribosylanthranilate isomerase